MRQALQVLFMILAAGLLPPICLSASIWYSPDTVHPGMSVEVEGNGFPPSAPFEILVDGAGLGNGSSTIGGWVIRTIDLGRLIGIGSHNLSVSCGGVTVQTHLVVTQWSVSASTDPSSLRPGEEISIQGEGYPPLGYFEVYLCGIRIATGSTDGQGALQVSYRIPESQPLGVQRVQVLAPMYAGPPSVTLSINVTPWEPRITLEPPCPSPGQVVEISGEDLPPNSYYKVNLDDETILVGTVDAFGLFSRGYGFSPQLPIGSHHLSQIVPDYTGPPKDEVDFQVVPWPVELRVHPGEIHPGIPIRIDASGLPPFSPFTVRIDSASVGSGTANSSGKASVPYQLPGKIELGLHTVVLAVHGYSGPPSDSIQINVTQWPLDLSAPGEIHPASSLPVEITGLPPNARCRVELDGKMILSNKSDATGSVRASIWLSMSTALGWHSISCVATNFTGPPYADRDFKVTQWPLHTQLSPRFVYPGSSLHIDGWDFPPDTTCQIFLDSTKIWEGLSDGDGSLDVSYDLQRDLPPGCHDLMVIAAFPGSPRTEEGFNISQWPLSVSIYPPSCLPGGMISVNGTGYPPGSKIEVSLDGVYVKAAISNVDGSISTDLVVPPMIEHGYHLISIEVAGGYTGPPRVHGFFYSGANPPERRFFAADSSGRPRSVFYPSDKIYVYGAGYPPSEQADIYVTPGGQEPETSKAVHSVNISTDPEGRVQGTVYVAGEGGTFGLWVDLNRDGIMDNLDFWIDRAFSVMPRPDVSIVNASIQDTNPTRGEKVQVFISVFNKGQLAQNATALFLFGDQVAAQRLFEVQPRQVAQVVLVWNTSLSTPSSRAGQVLIPSLDGELNMTDNKLDLGEVVLRPSPNLSVSWLRPLQRMVKRGEIARVETSIRNGAASAEEFTIRLVWGGKTEATEKASVLPLQSRTFPIQWDTSTALPGQGEIGIYVQVLPYELDSSDNYLENGTLEILPPNVPPTADVLGPYKGLAGVATSFDASWSYDIDGEIVSYVWEFGDGSSAEGEVVNHTYLEAGTYPVVLTVWDDDGAWSVSRTTAVISPPPPSYNLTIHVQDAFGQIPLTASELKIDGVSVTPAASSYTIRLPEGIHNVSATMNGYRQASAVVDLRSDSEVLLAMMPAVRIVPCGFYGAARNRFAPTQNVYIRVDSPREYLLRIWIVKDGYALNGRPILDSTGQGPKDFVFREGRSVLPIWTGGLRPGAYDVILDVNADGVYQRGVDVLESEKGPLFTVPEGGLLTFCLVLLTLFKDRGHASLKGDKKVF